LNELVARSLDPFRHEGHDRFEIKGPDVDLDDKVFTGLALLFHELATNAAKHGALSVPDGRVALNWEIDAALLRIS
jgi:two-component sensor histidine kinase